MTVANECREAFEKWYETDAYPLEHSNWFKREPDDPDEYVIPHVHQSWVTWQAAWNSRRAPDARTEVVAWKYGLDASHWFDAKLEKPDPLNIKRYGIVYAYALRDRQP